MARRIFLLVSSLACAIATHAAEDIHFLAEHAVESGMDAAYMALPWPAGRLASREWQASVDLATASTTTEFMRLDGTIVAVAAARSINERWGYQLIASSGEFGFSGGDGHVTLTGRFLGDVPLELPQFAGFDGVRGTQTQLSVGAAAIRARDRADPVHSSQLIAGLLLERVQVTRLRMDYQLVGGADSGASGALNYDSRANFVTPFLAWQQTRELAGRWAWSLRAMLIAPLPPAALDARLTGAEFDVSTPRTSQAIAIGDPFVVLGVAFRHQPSGLEIDLGGAFYFAEGESASHPGVEDARVLHVAWRPRCTTATHCIGAAKRAGRKIRLGSKGNAKVPEVTPVFWVIKIAATTLGETGGDAVSMSMNLGYLLAIAIFAGIFVVAVAIQIAVKRFHSSVYWITIVATTTVGTTLADFATRSLGIGYSGGTALLLILLIASLGVWYRTMGTVAVDSVSTPRAEAFYWVTIMASQTLGTALGDWTADTAALGYSGAAAVFGALLSLIAAGHFCSRVSPTLLFWSAFVLTRPLGAVVGDLLDKPIAAGGLALSRYSASAVLFTFIVACILFVQQRAASKSH